jgi:hypothetical protein
MPSSSPSSITLKYRITAWYWTLFSSKTKHSCDHRTLMARCGWIVGGK